MTITNFLPLRDEMVKMAYHLGAIESNVEDIVQDVYIKLIDIEGKEGSLNRIEYKGEPNKAYLYMMVRSRVANAFRLSERQRKEEVAFVHNASIRDTMEEVEEQHEREANLYSELNELHFFPRMVFEAYVLDDHSIRTLSEATNIGRQTLRNEINYVRERIKRKTNDANR